MAPPSGGGEASLKEQKEAGLEQGEADSSGHEVGLMRSPAPGCGDWEKEGLGTPPALLLTSPREGVEAVTMELVTMGRRVGRLRNREERRDGGTPDPPSSMLWTALPSRLGMGSCPPLAARAGEGRKVWTGVEEGHEGEGWREKEED